MLLTLYEQRIYRLLATRRPLLASRRATGCRIGSAAQARPSVGAGPGVVRALHAGRARCPTSGSARPSPPTRSVLLPRGEDRFGVAWEVLAAIMLVETRMGRIRSNSSAGAQGPMQFLPSTWDAYGLGGDIHDPHDAVLGAANYLDASGAPEDYRRALYAYNPVDAYVTAVWSYAKTMMRDPSTYYAFYNWQVFVRTTDGDVRLSGPGLPGLTDSGPPARRADRLATCLDVRVTRNVALGLSIASFLLGGARRVGARARRSRPVLPAPPGGPFAWLADAVGLDCGARFGARRDRRRPRSRSPPARSSSCCARPGAGRSPRGRSLVLAVAYHAALLLLPLLFSRDVYSYAAYGKIAATYHANPYVATPADFPGDVLARFVGPKWFDTPAVYGPLWTQLSALVVRAAPRRRGAGRGRSAPRDRRVARDPFRRVARRSRAVAERAAFAVAAVGANPVVLFQSAASGHNDLLVALGRDRRAGARVRAAGARGRRRRSRSRR